MNASRRILTHTAVALALSALTGLTAQAQVQPKLKVGFMLP